MVFPRESVVETEGQNQVYSDNPVLACLRFGAYVISVILDLCRKRCFMRFWIRPRGPHHPGPVGHKPRVGIHWMMLCSLTLSILSGCGQSPSTSHTSQQVTSKASTAATEPAANPSTTTQPQIAANWLENPQAIDLSGRYGRRLQIVWKDATRDPKEADDDDDSMADRDVTSPSDPADANNPLMAENLPAGSSQVTAGNDEAMGGVLDQKPDDASVSQSSQADWYVLIDGEPVRDESGILLSIPCEVRVPPGPHEVTLAQPGMADLSKKVEIRQDRKLSFERPEKPERGASSLSGPLFDLAKGEFLPLDELNTAGKEYDPWLSTDGLTLVFAGDRAEGRGVYLATRPTRYHEFSPARLIEITRSGEFVATPVLSPDGLSLIYVHPARTRIWLLERNSVDEPFIKREALRSIDQPGFEWIGAQLMFPEAISQTPQFKASANFHLAWIERNAAGQQQVFVAEGPSLGSLSKAQGKAVILPGDRPWFTASTDRQFSLDGPILQRWIREQSLGPVASALYGNPSPIGEFPDGFPPPLANERSLFITDDEQWAVAAVTSAASEATLQQQPGDLMLLRLSDGPQWGWKFQGRSLKPTPSTETKPPTLVADQSASNVMNAEDRSSPATTNPPPAVREEMDPSTKTNADPAATVMNQPAQPVETQTAYTSYEKSLDEFRKALEARDYEQAAQILQQRQQTSFATAWNQLTELDLAWLQKLNEFQAMVNDGVRQLEPGSTVRVGSAKLELIGLKEGVLSLKSRLKTIEKPLWEMSTGDLLALAESLPGGTNQASALKTLAFVKADPLLPARVIELWLGRAGPGGQDFLEAFSTRELEEGRLALAENRLSNAIEHFGKAIAAGPEKPAAQAAEQEKARLYDRTRWKIVGKRDWARGPEGEWSADARRIDGAYLVSESDYENFVCEFEWKADQPGAQGGLYFHYAGEGNPFEFGYKIHLAGDMDQQGMDQYSTGALFGSDAPKKKVAKKNAWNRFRLTVVGPKTTVQINDEVVLETDVPVSKSEPRGFLAIDGVGGAFRYRKILVYEPSPTPATKAQN